MTNRRLLRGLLIVVVLAIVVLILSGVWPG
jgi:hypothetical protein